MSNVDDLQLIVELAERGVSCPKCGAQFEIYSQPGRNVRHYEGCAIADAKRRLAALPGEHR